nr:MAG TPA: hypothetical protein [Caudoviricetes sp.]
MYSCILDKVECYNILGSFKMAYLDYRLYYYTRTTYLECEKVLILYILCSETM